MLTLKTTSEWYCSWLQWEINKRWNMMVVHETRSRGVCIVYLLWCLYAKTAGSSLRKGKQIEPKSRTTQRNSIFFVFSCHLSYKIYTGHTLERNFQTAKNKRIFNNNEVRIYIPTLNYVMHMVHMDLKLLFNTYHKINVATTKRRGLIKKCG